MSEPFISADELAEIEARLADADFMEQEILDGQRLLAEVRRLWSLFPNPEEDASKVEGVVDGTIEDHTGAENWPWVKQLRDLASRIRQVRPAS